MKISHMQLFIDSLIHPKKLAAFRIMPIGKVIQYVFLLVLLVTAFSLGKFITNGADEVFNYGDIEQYVADLQWLVYLLAIVILFIINSLTIFAKISLYAFVGQLITKPMNRRSEYRQMWRTTAFASTWATLLTMLLPLFPLSSTITTLIGTFITALFLVIAITKYPLLKR